MMIEDTLLIRHLPATLSHVEKIDLLQHFGAVDVSIVGPESKKSNLVYARFENVKAAQVAVQKLHQLNVLGQRISAEVARGPTTETVDPVDTSKININDERQDQISKAKDLFLKKLGISIKNYDFNQPPPLNIYYQYPPPTKSVLLNICKAMANVPKLYNQVLHLMNKMNLPCPFVDVYPLDSELFREKEIRSSAVEYNTVEDEDDAMEIAMSENESEMGSDTEQQTGEIIPAKRKRADRKVFKRPKFMKPQARPPQSRKVGLKIADVFENTQQDHVQKKIELKITSDLSSIQEAQEIQAVESTKEGLEVVKVPKKVQEKTVEPVSKEDSNLEDADGVYITGDQLAANRVPTRDQRLLPVFKNYQAGAPSCRLYIKNLAKNVQTKDLHFIYKRYYRTELDAEQGSMFDIRLMQEGRMKGQAFVTLQSVDLAQAALKDTNGFILKDKPMVVQFARSAATK